MHRPDTLNRVILASIGAAITAAGTYTLLRARGALGVRRANEALLSPSVQAFVADHHWFWWATAAACVVVAIISLLWLRAQLRPTRPANDDLASSQAGGQTTVLGAAAAAAVAADAGQLQGVTASTARVWGDPSHARVYLQLNIDDDVATKQLFEDLRDETLRHLALALQAESVTTDLDLRLAGPPDRVVA